MTRKTSTSKSRTTSSKTSTGKKVTSSRGASKATKSSSQKSKTQEALKKNQRSLTTTTTPAKAKVKSTKTSTNSTKRSSTKARQKQKDLGPKYTRSANLDLFPHVNMFPWRLEDRKEKKTCWFTCYDHATKYITRYSLTAKQYKLQCHTSVPHDGATL